VPAFWSEAALMATSGLYVAAVAVPVGLVARAARPKGEPLLPRWKPWRVPWNGFEVFVAFLVTTAVLPSVVTTLLADAGFYRAVYGADFPAPGAQDVAPERQEEAKNLRALWAVVFTLPVQMGLLWGAVRALYPTWKPEFVGRGSFAAKVWFGVLAWLVFTPVVLTFHAVVNTLFEQFGVKPEKHPLTQLGNLPALEQVLFMFRATVAPAVIEEVLFRGLLLAWCVGRMKIPGAGVSPVTGARPWIVMAVAVAVATLQRDGRIGPVVFAGLLAAGLGVLWRFQRTGARRARAVYATAALFAVVHSSVWPNPIPLFLLGLGLGWLAVRTNGVLVPVIVHALFNAVSAVAVLRGGG
jgi:hypothetical protein